METVYLFETLASTGQSTRRQNPEEQHRYSHRRGDLRCHTPMMCYDFWCWLFTLQRGRKYMRSEVMCTSVCVWKWRGVVNVILPYHSRFSNFTFHTKILISLKPNHMSNTNDSYRFYSTSIIIPSYLNFITLIPHKDVSMLYYILMFSSAKSIAISSWTLLVSCANKANKRISLFFREQCIQT